MQMFELTYFHKGGQACKYDCIQSIARKPDLIFNHVKARSTAKTVLHASKQVMDVLHQASYARKRGSTIGKVKMFVSFHSCLHNTQIVLVFT